MLKPEQIPDEVAEALITTLHGKPGLPYREAIAAAINAWPGAFRGNEWPNLKPIISLPLAENTNAED